MRAAHTGRLKPPRAPVRPHAAEHQAAETTQKSARQKSRTHELRRIEFRSDLDDHRAKYTQIMSAAVRARIG